MASYLMPRPFPYNAARFRVAFRLHLAAFIGLAIAAVVLLRLSSRLLPIAYIFVIAMAMVFLLTIVNAWPPVRTVHTVDGEALTLRQGWGFRLAVPLSKISKAKRTEIGAVKSGIRLDRANGVLEVVAAGPEAVRLRLKEPVAYKGVLVREVVVDVLEPREFIDCIKERKRGSVLIERLDTGKASAEPVDDAGEDLEEGPAQEDQGDDEESEDEARRAVTAERLKTWEGIKGKVLETPPSKAAKGKATGKPARPAPPPEPEEPEEPGEEEDSLAVLPDEDEIEVVPALPATPDARARVVRIPKRKE
jgi:hypothetical protein